MHLILRCNEPLTPSSTFSATLAKLLVLVQGHFVSRITTIGLISPTFYALAISWSFLLPLKYSYHSLSGVYVSTSSFSPPSIFATSQTIPKAAHVRSATRVTSTRQNCPYSILRAISSSRSIRSKPMVSLGNQRFAVCWSTVF